MADATATTSPPSTLPLVARLVHAIVGLGVLGGYVAVHLVRVALAPLPAAHPVPGIGSWLLAALCGYHAIYGFWLLGNRRDNVDRVPTARNWLYTVSRWSSPVVLLFIGYHAVGANVMGVADHVRQEVSGVRAPWLYGVGTAAVLLHLGRGTYSACIDLGLATSPAARRAIALAAAALVLGMAVLAALGLRRVLHG